MKQKIGILTFHASNNSGSMLQAHALQLVLSSQPKIDCTIIDFSNASQRRMYSLFVVPRNFKEFVRNFVYLLFFPILFRYQNDYKNFAKKYFNLSKKQYLTLEELKKESFQYDCMICGSDQVWNTSALDFDDAYFLPFGGKEVTRIAYAVSLGATDYLNFTKQCQKKYSNLINRLDHVSVREYNAKVTLDELCQQDFKITADPTLLVEKEYWQGMQCDRLVEGNYIFWYAMTYTGEHLKRIINISKKYKMPVYMFDTREWIRRALFLKGIKLATASGPSALLSLLQHAEIIITSSLHGTIFSTLLERNFWYYQKDEHNENDDRASFLLKQLKQSNRLLSTYQLEETNLLISPDYKETRQNIKLLKEQSMEFLKTALN